MRQTTILKVVILLIFVSLSGVTTLLAKPDTSVKTTLHRAENPDNNTKSVLVLPYIFATESMGFTAGIGGGTKGYGQEQLTTVATAFYSNDDASGLFLGVWDYQLSFAKRLFLSADAMRGHYPRQRAYARQSYDLDSPRPGSNDSDENSYYENSGYSNWIDIKAEYVLPIGSAKDDPMIRNELKGGLLQSEPLGGETWNPLKNGVTILLLQQYNRLQSFEPDEGDLEFTIHPVQIGIAYYNTDFPTNPSTGSNQYFSVTHDFRWLDSPDDWTFLEFEASKYFSLGESKWAKQRIIALNIWTADNISWEEEEHTDAAGKTTIRIRHRAPFYDGATLGGFCRMRAYPTNRFNDKSVLYTTAEYRYTLRWNPIGNVSCILGGGRCCFSALSPYRNQNINASTHNGENIRTLISIRMKASSCYFFRSVL